MKPWILHAFISMAFAGITAVVAKLGLSGISAELGLAIRTCFVFASVIAFSTFTVPASQFASLGYANYFWLGCSGVTAAGSWIFYFKAIKDGEVSTVALIDKGSIVVTVLLASIVLKEQLTPRTLLGAALMAAGLLLVTRK